jgi:triosephosphate isomerase
LFHLDSTELKNCIIAYEPVWAIGTGRTATSAQAEEMHAAIRGWLADKYGHETAENMSILYGGSCNASNAKELFACPNVDGGLIGGAALDAASFLKIVDSF